jgi:prophage regulatory protein
MATETATTGHGASGCALRLAIATVREASAVTGLSERTIYRAMERGEFVPRVRLSPRRFGFRVTDLMAWLNERREPPRSSTSTPNF